MLTEGVLADKVVGLPRNVPERLVQLGIHNPAAIALINKEELCFVFGPDVGVAQQAANTCARFCGSVAQCDLLSMSLKPIDPSWYEEGAFQQDTPIELQLQYRRLDMRRDMLSLKNTTDRFRRVYPRLSDVKVWVAKSPVDAAYAQGFVPPINSMLQVDARQKGDHPYQLQHHTIGRPTASTVKAISRLNPPERAHAASRHAHEQASGIRHIPHWSLTRTGRHDTRTAAVGLDIPSEQLLIIQEDGKVASPYAKELEVKAGVFQAEPPDVVQLLQQAGSPAEAKDPNQKQMRINVEAAVKQLASFCRDATTCWVFFGTFNFTWAMMLEGDIAHISDPVRCIDTEPSTLLLLYYVCCKGIEEAEGRSAPPSDNTDGQDATSGAGSSSQDADDDDDDGAPAAAAGGGDSTASYAGPVTRSRARNAAYTQTTKIRDLAAAALAACTVDLDLVQGFLGSGWTGRVFDYLMSDGTPAALKVAQPGSGQAVALSIEASVLLALRSRWGNGVAGLLASGTGKDGHSCVLAVERIPNSRRLEPSSDEDVLQQLKLVLEAVHICDVAHMNLSRENILVQQLPNGSKKAWLIGWMYAAVQATQQQKQQDWQRVQALFGAKCAIRSRIVQGSSTSTRTTRSSSSCSRAAVKGRNRETKCMWRPGQCGAVLRHPWQ